MECICAWCNKTLSSAEEFEADGVITHGICSSCALELTKDSPRTTREILRLIREPIFVVNSDTVVKAANSSAAELLNKQAADLEENLPGDALECTFSKTGKGCGKTIHCKTCTVRNTITDTINSGACYNNVPAYQNIDTPDGPKVMRFSISTEKVGEMILLRIDDLDTKASAQ